jgi:ADP-ribosylglycohydrolase
MALCLADSLLACGGFDAADQMERCRRWWQEGYRSSTGRCFDIGNTVSAALRRYEAEGEPLAGSTDPGAAGNGSLMRLAPIPIYYAAQPALAMERAALMSRTTHGAREAVDACRYYAGLIVGALAGAGKEALCGPRYHPAGAQWGEDELAPAVLAVAEGSFRERSPPAIRGTGYVVQALEAALWAFWHAEDFRDGALAAVNLGDDTDTTGGIYGQLAGAFYGEEGIPAAWLQRLHQGAEIAAIADALAGAHPA